MKPLNTQHLYQNLKQIAESAVSPLFTLFKDDFYKHDFDVIKHDLQPQDVYYWALKQCGTYLTLADKDSEYMKQLLSEKVAPERRHFLISVDGSSEHGYSIKEYTMSTIGAAIAAVKINPKRKPTRRFLFDVITELEPKLAGSVLFSDFTCGKGGTLYLHLTQNSMTYITSAGKFRSIGLPFDTYRKVGAFKVCVTSSFGHATLEQIKLSVFQRAQKRLLSISKSSA